MIHKTINICLIAILFIITVIETVIFVTALMANDTANNLPILIGTGGGIIAGIYLIALLATKRKSIFK